MAFDMTAYINATAEATRISRDVVAHLQSGATDDRTIWAKHWHPEFESVESDGRTYKGTAAVHAKCKEWMDQTIVHGFDMEGPFVTPNGFAMKYTIDVEGKDGSMPRMKMSEVGVYTIKGGKIVREEFFGTPMA